MKKRILAFVFAIVLCAISALPAFASVEPYYFVDAAGLISDYDEIQNIEQKLADVSKKNKIDIAIVTVDSMDGQSGKEFAEFAHESLEYTSDCVMLLVSMEYRDVTVSSFGERGRDIISTSDCDSIRTAVTPDLSDGDYYEAFTNFAEEVDSTIYNAEHFNIFFSLLISLGVGIVIALIVVLVMKSQLKSVRFQSAAANYLKEGSMQVTAAYENFLYRNVSRTPKSTSSSSSGSSNSSSGKF